jgi:DNA-binding MarR family transcriptional regulator
MDRCMGAGRAIQSGANDRAAALTALRGLIGSLTQSARSIESHTGITNAQLFLLRQFTTAKPLSVNELAERVHARQNTVSSVVGRLTVAGLVEKVRSSTDGRRAALSLTPKGRRLLKRAPASPVEVLIAALETLSSRDARQLAGGLQALVTNLNLDVDAAPMLFESSNTRKSRRR